MRPILGLGLLDGVPAGVIRGARRPVCSPTILDVIAPQLRAWLDQKRRTGGVPAPRPRGLRRLFPGPNSSSGCSVSSMVWSRRIDRNLMVFLTIP